MNKSILVKIKKKIIIINVIIIFIISLHYYFNKNRFNMFDLYLDYTFSEKLFLNLNFNSGNVKSDEGRNFFLENVMTSFFLRDLNFNKKFYKINDLTDSISAEKITFYMNIKEEKLEFKISKKDKKIFNIKFGDTNKDSIEKDIKIIDNYLDGVLDQFHERLRLIFAEKIKDNQNELKELEILTRKINEGEKTTERINLSIIYLKNEIRILSNLLNSIENGERFVDTNTYTKKFRKKYFKTDEYILCALIVLFLTNIIIRNSDRIFR